MAKSAFPGAGFCAMVWASQACLTGLTMLALPTASFANVDKQQANIRALSDKGIYWYDRFRFDLAVQSFNKILLIEPTNPSALRWQGLTDLARGDMQAAAVWLGKLQSLHGNNSPYAIELQQAMTLASDKRQQLAELRYLANSEQVPPNLLTRVRQLLPQPPVGESAIQIYRLLSNSRNDREYARTQVTALARQFPDDKRYQALLATFGTTTQTQTAQASPSRPTTSRANRAPQTARAPQPPAPVIEIQADPEQVEDTAPQLSAFEQGQILSDSAIQLLEQGEKANAAAKLQEAVDLNPVYPWFRYDLAILLDDQGDKGSRWAARRVMEEGMEEAPTPEMRFASALLAARQNRNDEVLAFLNEVPRENWTEGMTALEKRVQYGQHLNALNELAQQSQFNQLASTIVANPQWRAEPEIQGIEQELRRKQQVRVQMSYQNALIEGDEGVSKINTKEIPLQVDLPIDLEKTAFIRMDTLNVNAGRVDPATASNFAQLGTTVPTDPAIGSDRLDQNYKGHVVGIGMQTDNYRVDLGTTVGDYPVNDWVGGAQWRTDLGGGSLRLEMARRMVTGSTLSTTGAVDPLTGAKWGGARRNGISAVYYQEFSPTVDFVGIARANLITGKHIPDNTEVNLQGIVGKTIFQRPGHEIEIGASLFLWSFQKNLRLYTFGQGGYYSPQAFGSISFPITWTGNAHGWSWQLQGRIGASESRQDDAELYPLNPELAAAAAAQGNPTVAEGGPGGGTSTGLRLSVERQVVNNFVVGGYFDIDRSEGYNPDQLQMYVKYSFGDFFELSAPPQGIAPYSRF